jgi:sorbitol-6-phosphate 2-dehydrogenase
MSLVPVVAPLLRGLLRQDGRLPILTVQETTVPGAVTIDLGGASDEAAILAALRTGLAHPLATPMPGAVTVVGVGTFVIQRSGATRIAVVTGAAQGFGLEIAQGLAASGYRVALVDRNASGAQAAAEAINGLQGAGSAVGLAMDVTDGASIAGALAQVVGAWGGLDLFVSNAGVVKAGSVKTQPLADFEFTTKVNYNGFFCCVQQAAPIQARQRKAAPGTWTDIVQINSKSGLQGSNKNGAYAGSKFGGIGLVQSFALELVEDGIKVNAICPGNFFDGPLWSDPKNGLFVQYLASGKVPGAKTVDDVKRFYEAKVPMNRGCRTEDVLRAIHYLVSQEYETGQALPVTGGQVMLN